MTIGKDRKYRFVIILALILSIVTLSVAFTIVDQVLSIDGTKKLTSSSWNITFDNLSSPSLVGSATIEKPAFLRNDSTTFSFEVSFKYSGDSVIYYFDVKNNGSIDAKISSINLLGIPNKTENLIWTLTYADGKELSIGDTLGVGITKNLKLVITATTIPAKDTSFNLGATIDYVQY